MPKLKTLKDINLKNQRALVRVDFDLPLDEKGNIIDDFRLKESLPTIKYLIKQKSKIILISHLDRPGGRRIKKLSLAQVAQRLRNISRKKVRFSKEITGWSVKKTIEMMGFGQILLLENLRFNPGEEKNSPKLAKELAGFGDIFINEAFAVSHREHASIVGISRYLPSVLGFRFEKEIKELNKILFRPKRPLVAVIGGAKISTKIKVINKFLQIADYVLIGGALSNTIFASRGFDMADSVIDKESFEDIEKINLRNPKLFLPIDLAIWNKNRVYYKDVSGLFKGEKALDIGPKTIDLFSDLIEKAKMIIWNGPLGLTIQKPFDKASKAIVDAISETKAYSVVGGGDTIAFIREIKKEKVFDHLSTGGGAMLDYLANETLSGTEAIKECKRFGK
ncbi:MAG: phosphoglycerate kinase [Candidatus Portnoybacteria bacterium CG10_big_fil_rev_8_21_14_0_10_38_18]|uniref:Phosphoglycerate kinase n=1 Tax=Candidatus Portnoybacteria bacterium CG10_big_fil_rev_8_21_14_0_10_38_18 TaxID=1974813 RepID=A0A2M8KCG1_9BACT|nr:MAG: phosphoglycerate kinase [Candidatus Portnoybacteria bacterium CG10_big_fil_rev_8_21_14_0_10_38_18]